MNNQTEGATLIRGVVTYIVIDEEWLPRCPVCGEAGSIDYWRFYACGHLHEFHFGGTPGLINQRQEEGYHVVALMSEDSPSVDVLVFRDQPYDPAPVQLRLPGF